MTAPATARRALWPLLALLVAGCGAGDLAPYQGLPRPAPAGTVETGERIGICYNALFSTPAKVRAAAADACGPESIPELLHQDMRLNCPLMTPVRATFLCVPG